MIKWLMQRKISGETFRIENIRTRLLVIMLLLMTSSFAFLTGVNYYFSDKAMTQSIQNTAAAIGTDYATRMRSFVQELVLTVSDMAENPYIIEGQDRQKIVSVLAQYLQKDPRFTGINYGDLEGNVLRAQGDYAYLGNRRYYQEAVKTKKLTISEPLISRGSGRLSLAIAAPIFTNGELTGILQATLPLDSLNEIVGSIKFMDTGYGFVVDQSGMLVAHSRRPDLNGKVNLREEYQGSEDVSNLPELDTRLLQLFKQALRSNEQVQGIYTIPSGPVFTVFTPTTLPGGGKWLIGVSAPEEEVTHDVKFLNKILIFSAVFCLLSGVLIIVMISRRFARPEEKYFKTFRHVADAIGIVNLKNRKFIEVNDAFYRLLGYSPEEIIEHTSEEFGLWNEGDGTDFQEILESQGSVYDMECQWKTRAGDLRTGIISAENIEIAKEKLSIFIWHDITEQKKAEAALKKAYDHLEQTVEERTQELFGANQELTAMNEEMIAINEELQNSNHALEEENHIRKIAEERLRLRERQYRATTGLLTKSVETTELTETVLKNAMQLVEADAGFIGMFSGNGKRFQIQYGRGIRKEAIGASLVINPSPLGYVLRHKEIFHIKGFWWKVHLQPEESKSDDLPVYMVFVPLKKGGQVKGILAAAWKYDENTQRDEAAEVLQQFADLAFFSMERTLAQEKMEYIAFHDKLTGLPNRLSLHMQLEEELKKSRDGQSAGVLLLIDIDDLKAVNDTFGHSVGDKVIMEMGDSLKKAFAQTAFVGRVTGDGFVVMVPGTCTAEEGSALAERALQQICRDYVLQEEKIQMTASIGVVLYPESGEQPDDILKRAEAAMYAAKEAGRNCWRMFEPSLLKRTAEDMLLFNSLRKALAKKEFFLMYQPQLTTDGSKVVGLEALLRWQSAEFGLVSPGRFIPLAERGRLIVDIGKWVFREACKFARQLQERGYDHLRVAINISPRQIKEENFVAEICKIIEDTGADPRQLEIEVTENVFMETVEESVAKLLTLQKYGISLAVDDFGTGFSSLSYLRNLPVNCLKIDKSFIDEIAADDTQLQFVNSIIRMGHTLSMDIVAEGVEKEAQLSRLLNCRCDYIQGYVFSKPLPAEAALSLLEEKRH